MLIKTTLSTLAFLVITATTNAKTPNQIINLHKWTLNDPESGAEKISSSDLLGGYNNEWFEESVSNNVSRVRFTTPKNGKTTSGSDQVRTELRFQVNNSSTNHSDNDGTFKPEDNYQNKVGTHFRMLRALDGQVMMGQVHTKNSGKRPMLKLIWNDGSSSNNNYIVAEHMSYNSSNSGYAKPRIEGLERNKNYKFNINMYDYQGDRCLHIWLGRAGVTYGQFRTKFGEEVADTGVTLKTDWLNDDCYYKMGLYNKTEKSSSTPGGSTSAAEFWNLYDIFQK